MFWTFPGIVVQNVSFMLVLLACLYSIACCLFGIYADLPIISDAVYVQLQAA